MNNREQYFKLRRAFDRSNSLYLLSTVVFVWLVVVPEVRMQFLDSFHVSVCGMGLKRIVSICHLAVTGFWMWRYRRFDRWVFENGLPDELLEAMEAKADKRMQHANGELRFVGGVLAAVAAAVWAGALPAGALWIVGTVLVAATTASFFDKMVTEDHIRYTWYR